MSDVTPSDVPTSDTLTTHGTTLYGPRTILEIIRDLRPTYRFRHVGEITPAFLQAEGIRLAIWDIDGTLMSYHGLDVARDFSEHIRGMFVNGPARHAILSNCDEERFRVLGGIFPEIPVIRGYTSPEGPILRVIENGRDSHPPAAMEDVLRRGRLIRKPSGDLIRLAARHFEIADPNEILMVGDQYLTDVATANMGGARSVRVPAYRRDTFPVRIRLSQRAEQLFARLRHPFS